MKWNFKNDANFELTRSTWVVLLLNGPDLGHELWFEAQKDAVELVERLEVIAVRGTLILSCNCLHFRFQSVRDRWRQKRNVRENGKERKIRRRRRIRQIWKNGLDRIKIRNGSYIGSGGQILKRIHIRSRVQIWLSRYTWNRVQVLKSYIWNSAQTLKI